MLNREIFVITLCLRFWDYIFLNLLDIISASLYHCQNLRICQFTSFPLHRCFSFPWSGVRTISDGFESCNKRSKRDATMGVVYRFIKPKYLLHQYHIISSKVINCALNRAPLLSMYNIHGKQWCAIVYERIYLVNQSF